MRLFNAIITRAAAPAAAGRARRSPVAAASCGPGWSTLDAAGRDSIVLATGRDSFIIATGRDSIALAAGRGSIVIAAG